MSDRAPRAICEQEISAGLAPQTVLDVDGEGLPNLSPPNTTWAWSVTGILPIQGVHLSGRGFRADNPAQDTVICSDPSCGHIIQVGVEIGALKASLSERSVHLLTAPSKGLN